MNIHERRFLLLISIFLILAIPTALGQGTTSGPAGNNAIGDANEINFAQSVQQSISSAGESYYYKFHIDTSGIVHVKVENVPQDMVPVVYLWNKNGGDPIATKAANNPGDSVTLDKDLLGPSWHYLQVYDRAGKAYSQPYTLTVSFDPAPDPYEPNDGFGDAKKINFGQSVTAYICPHEDTDFYKFYINNSGIAHVKIENAPSDMVSVIYLWNKNGEDPIATASASNPGDSVTLTKDILGPGWYYIEVYDRANQAYNQPYSLTLNFDSAPDPYEPNNGFGDATGINFDQPIQAYICPHEDTDYYKINVSNHGVLSLKVENVPQDMVPVIYLFNMNGGDPIAAMAANNPGDSVTLEKGVSGTGLYYVQVYDRAGEAYSHPYTLTATMKASG